MQISQSSIESESLLPVEVIPQIIELDPTSDGGKSLADLMAEHSSNERDQPFLFIVPDMSAHSSLERVQQRVTQYPRRRAKQDRIARYERLYKLGYTVTQIAEMEGLSVAAISAFMIRNGKSFKSIA